MENNIFESIQWLKITEIFLDLSVDEVLLTGCQHVSLASAHGVKIGKIIFASNTEMARWLLVFARTLGTRLDPQCGSAGGHLELANIRNDAKNDVAQLELRWHCVLPPLSIDGPLLALRRHRFASVGLTNFARHLGISKQIRDIINLGIGVLIAGPTGSGKSTFLAALLKELFFDQRIVIIESIPELPALSPHWVRLVERSPNIEGRGAISLARLVHESLRLRPDRMVFGEIRGPEAPPFVEALTSGHGGALATIHASSPEEAVHRLSDLAIRYGGGKSFTMGRMTLGVVVMRRGSPPEISELKVVTL